VLALWPYLTTACRAEPAQVIIIRHAEKPPDGSDRPERDDLSLEGRERAAALVPYFRGNQQVLKFDTPVAIYAQSSAKQHSRRPIQTVQPLASALGVPLIDKFARDDVAEMVKEINANPAYRGKMVLICWEHHVIPKIATAFGAEDAPKEWPGKYFDRLWIITFREGERPDFRERKQRLMFGDSE
jgi:broad specificity phosphatase PhoE